MAAVAAHRVVHRVVGRQKTDHGLEIGEVAEPQTAARLLTVLACGAAHGIDQHRHTEPVKASTTVSQKASNGERDTKPVTPEELPFRGVIDHASDDDVVGQLGLVDHLAYQDETQVLSMMLL